MVLPFDVNSVGTVQNTKFRQAKVELAPIPKS